MEKVIIFVKVEVHPDLKCNNFVKKTQEILRQKNGWRRSGIEFIFDENAPHQHNMSIALASNAFIKHECKFDCMSCTFMNRGKCFINYCRWLNGNKKVFDNLDDYRSYVVNHEMGHMLGLHDKTSKFADGTQTPQQKGAEQTEPFPGVGNHLSIMHQHTLDLTERLIKEGAKKSTTPTELDINDVKLKQMKTGGASKQKQKQKKEPRSSSKKKSKLKKSKLKKSKSKKKQKKETCSSSKKKSKLKKSKSKKKQKKEPCSSSKKKE
jgi:hypothetical protein